MDNEQATAEARKWADRLRANTDDFYADRITYTEFTYIQRATWDAIAAAGAQHNVSAVLRGDLADIVA